MSTATLENALDVPANCEVLEGLVDTNYLMRMFARSDLTIIKWRQEHGLPYVQINGEGRPAVRYRLDRVRRWARQQGRKIVCDPAGDVETRPIVVPPNVSAGNMAATTAA